MEIAINGIEAFNSNKDWLKTVHTLAGKRAYSNEEIKKMTEDEATSIVSSIMNE